MIPTAPDSGKHREIVAVHLIFQRAFSHLVEAVKIQCHPSPVRVDQTMERLTARRS